MSSSGAYDYPPCIHFRVIRWFPTGKRREIGKHTAVFFRLAKVVTCDLVPLYGTPDGRRASCFSRGIFMPQVPEFPKDP